MARVFLSHSSKDKPFVRELHRRLTRDGVTCFFDEESIEWGANFVLTLEEAIDTCQHFVAILSPDFVKSEWVKLERTSSMANDLAGIERKIRPLRLHPCTLPRFLTPIQSIDVSTTALFDANYPKICKALGGTVRPDPKPPTDRATLPPVTSLPHLFRMPYRSLEDKFVGRVHELWAIFDQLSRGQTSIVQGVGVVSGIGGLGKTQLAVEYAHRFNHHYPGGVFWIEADQGIPRLIDVLSHSGDVEVDGKRPQADQLEEIWTALTRRAAILAILDNFPEDVPLKPWLPPAGSIHVLVTTRRRDLSHPHVPLPLLTAGEGVALLNSGRLRWGPEAQPLVEDVGGLPLALELLRSYLELRPDLSVADIRRVLAETGGMSLLQEFADEYRDELPTGHERSVVATFQVSWDRAGIDARDVLRAMSHLAPVAVPLRLLRASLSWEHAPGPSDRLEKALSELVRLSLIDRSPSNEPLAHRLILAFVRHLRESASAQLPVVQAVEQEMSRAFDEQDTESFQQLEGIMPHAEFVISRTNVLPETAIIIATALGRHHTDLGRYVLAKSFYEDALSRAERNYPPGNPSIATRQSNLALVLKDLGKLTESRDLLRKALASNERSFPPGHPYIAISQSNLALALQAPGELAEARDLLRQALASNELGFPPGHPYIAISQSNLALALEDLGELAEARDLLRKALASDERSFPPGHPSIATSQSNLAMVLKDLGELAEARDLLRKALASTLDKFGPDHPTTKTIQRNLNGLPGSGE